jgi:hypothetical protein
MLDPRKMALINFVLQRHEMSQMMTRKPEAVFLGTCRCSFAVYDAVCEKEARQKIEEANLEFKKTPEFYLALAEYYKFGCNEKLPIRAGPGDLYKCSYWYIQAAEAGSREALLFLDRMVPEFFIADISLVEVRDRIKQALEEQAKLTTPGATLEERKKEEAAADFVIDQLLFPERQDLAAAIRSVLQFLQDIETKVEQYLTSDKKN